MAIRPALTPLPHEPVLRDRVHQQLEHLIITRVLKPGQRLLENELADQLNVSRNPVREAFTVLARDRWVDHRPRQGVVVHEPTKKEIDDFFQIRRVLEAEAGRMAAAKATGEQIEEMRERVQEGWAALADGDEVAVAACNSRFHQLVHDAADNSVLNEMLTLIKKRTRWYFASVARARGSASWEEHEALLAAIVDRDGDAAARILLQHSESTANAYRAVMDEESKQDDEQQ